MCPQPTIAWTIADTDAEGAVRYQIDLKVFQDFGVDGRVIAPSLTTQKITGHEDMTLAIGGLHSRHSDSVEVASLPSAVKFGMPGSVEDVDAIANLITRLDCPFVCDARLQSGLHCGRQDPRMLSWCKPLLTRVALLISTLPMAGMLTGLPTNTPEKVERCGRALVELGAKSAMITGAHFKHHHDSDFWTDGNSQFWLHTPCVRVPQKPEEVHRLTSAAAAALALGYSVPDALVLARAYFTHESLTASSHWGAQLPIAPTGRPRNARAMPWMTSSFPQDFHRLEFPKIKVAAIRICPIVDSASWARMLFALGVETVQIRVKHLEGGLLNSEIRDACAAAAQYRGAKLFVNDHWTLACEHGAYGVHLGQDDLKTANLRFLAGSGMRLGLSTHGPAEAARALAVKPSYVAIGTIFQSPSKTFAHQPMGLEKLARLRTLIPCPVIAVGGITLDRAPEVFETGVDGIAVISDISRAKSVPARVKAWLDYLEKQHQRVNRHRTDDSR